MKHSRKRFQNFRQSYVFSTRRIKIHQSQPVVWPSHLVYVLLSGCDWWISILHVDNTYDWRKFWKRFRECFIFQSRVSTKTVVNDFWKDSLWNSHPVYNRAVVCDSEKSRFDFVCVQVTFITRSGIVTKVKYWLVLSHVKCFSCGVVLTLCLS